MNPEEVDKDFIDIIQKRNELAGLNYNDPQYDDKEEELHDMEDAFFLIKSFNMKMHIILKTKK